MTVITKPAVMILMSSLKILITVAAIAGSSAAIVK